MRYWPILLTCPFLQGCLAFAYPSVTQTPPIVVQEADVKAFRVTEDISDRGWVYGIMTHGTCRIEEIPTDSGQIPALRDSYFAYLGFIFPIGGLSNIHENSIRLYRRGYETITVESHSWLSSPQHKSPEESRWKKAETLEAREKAIMALQSGLVVVRDSPAYQAFVAGEYEALANSPLAAGPVHDETRRWFQFQAKMLRGETPFDPSIDTTTAAALLGPGQ